MGLPIDCPEILEVCKQPNSRSRLQLDTEVVIIGNGPAGLSLSTFLSGWQPYYNPASPHPDEQLHSRLVENYDRSLLEQDLSWYEEEFAERIPPNIRPQSHLYDWLVRPETDSNSTQSCLKMVYEPARAVPHVVLGDTAVGGSWNSYDDEMVTVSLSHWMDLPGYSIADWLGGQPLLSRLPAIVVRKYMRAYAKRMRLNKHIRPFTKVTHIEKYYAPCGEEYWEVRAERRDGTPLLLKTRKVVLACGQNHVRMLDVDGELSEKHIVYDVASMKKFLTNDESCEVGPRPSKPSDAKVIVVGDGISAADAILHCLNHGIAVKHVMRRNEKQLRSTMMSRLTASVYPEYSKVFQLMLGRQSDPLYSKVVSSSVKSIRDDGFVVLETPQGEIMESFNLLVPCLGRRSELSMLQTKPEFGLDYRCLSDPSLFAVGSLAGDHFVRYLIGGCLQVAHTLLAEHQRTVALCQDTCPLAIPVQEDRPPLHEILCKPFMTVEDAGLGWVKRMFRVDSSPADLCNGFQLVNFEN